jgi:hypothetical protein
MTDGGKREEPKKNIREAQTEERELIKTAD